MKENNSDWFVVANAQKEKRKPVKMEENQDASEVEDEENTDVESSKKKTDRYQDDEIDSTRKHWKKKKTDKFWKKHPACIEFGKHHRRCQRVRDRHHHHHHHHGDRRYRNRKPWHSDDYSDESYEEYRRYPSRRRPYSRGRKPDSNPDETPFNRNKSKATTSQPTENENLPETDIDFTTLAN